MKKLFLLINVIIGLILNSNAQWQHSNTGLPTNTSVKDLVMNNLNIYAATSNGIYISTDNGNTWSAKNNGLTSLDINCIKISGQNIYAGGYGGLFLSTDNANNWAKISNEKVSTMTLNNSNIFIASDWASYGVALSTDNGNAWNYVNNGLPTSFIAQIGALTSLNNYIFAGVMNYGIFCSTDNGANWLLTDTASLNGNTCWFWDFATNGTILFITACEGLYKTINYGSNWTNINQDSTWQTDKKGLYYNDGKLFTAVFKYNPNKVHVYLSTNDGINWSDESNGLTDTSYVNSFLISGSDVLCATYTGHNGNNYYGDGVGVWRRPLSQIENILEMKENTSAVYPNPSMNDLIIENSQKSTIEIYNNQGQVILQQTLLKGKTHIDISKLKKGIYIYKLYSKDKIDVSKFIKE